MDRLLMRAAPKQSRDRQGVPMALWAAKSDEDARCVAKYCHFSELPSRECQGADVNLRSVFNGADAQLLRTRCLASTPRVLQ